MRETMKNNKNKNKCINRKRAEKKHDVNKKWARHSDYAIESNYLLYAIN